MGETEQTGVGKDQCLGIPSLVLSSWEEPGNPESETMSPRDRGQADTPVLR